MSRSLRICRVVVPLQKLKFSTFVAASTVSTPRTPRCGGSARGQRGARPRRSRLAPRVPPRCAQPTLPPGSPPRRRRVPAGGARARARRAVAEASRAPRRSRPATARAAPAAAPVAASAASPRRRRRPVTPAPGGRASGRTELRTARQPPWRTCSKSWAPKKRSLRRTRRRRVAWRVASALAQPPEKTSLCSRSRLLCV